MVENTDASDSGSYQFTRESEGVKRSAREVQSSREVSRELYVWVDDAKKAGLETRRRCRNQVLESIKKLACKSKSKSSLLVD